MQLTYYALRYKEGNEAGKMVAVDQDSGGYPYATHYPERAMLWADQESRARYLRHFPEFEPVTVTLTITAEG